MLQNVQSWNGALDSLDCRVEAMTASVQVGRIYEGTVTSVKDFVAEIKRRFGRIDVLVNNAGGALGLNPIEKAIDDEWIGMWKTNVLGLMWMTRACLPLLRKARLRYAASSAGVVQW